MKTIIIPTDFSAPSNNAIEYGVEMAKAINASILILHVYQVPVSIADTPVVLVSVEELRKSAEQKLNFVKQGLEEKNPGLKIYAEAVLGNIVDELEDLCEKIQPFAVVMGSKGTTGFEQALFGSTTLALIRNLKWPLICVPSSKKFGTGIRKIGFACDLNKVVESTPSHVIVDMARDFKSELHVLNIDHNNKHFKPETPQESILLETMLQEINPQYHFIDNKNVEEGLDSFAVKNDIDLLIAIPKKHTLLDSLLHYSHTKELVFHCHVPVMCLHED
jgi:nucleotide-binding universal stress UspA family protein